MDKYKTLFSNTVIFGLSNALSKIILSLLLPLYTRTLSTEQYGIAEIIVSISQLVIPLCSLAIQEAVFRFAMEKEKKEEVLKNGMFVAICSVLPLFSVGLCLQKSNYLKNYIIYFVFICFSSMMRTILSLYTKATKNTTFFAIDNILYNSFLGIINVILLALWKLELKGYFTAIIVSNFLSIIYLSAKNTIGKVLIQSNINWKLLKEMIVYSLPLIFNSISWGITHIADKLMISSMCSAEEVGIYSAATKIPSILSAITGVFTQAWTLSAIQEFKSEKTSNFYNNVFIVTHITVVFGTLLILLINNNLLLFVMGNEYSEAIIYSPIILLGVIFLMYSNFYSPIYSAMKKSKQIMLSSFEGAIINIILNYILIPKVGVLGACVATAVSYMYIAIYRMLKLKRYFKLQIDRICWYISIMLIIIDVFVVINRKHEIIVTCLFMIINFKLYYIYLKSLITKLFKIKLLRKGDKL